MKTIAVIFGGKSAEHDVSIITAHTPIIDSLLASKEYDVWPVYITKEGKWYADKAMNDMAFFKRPDYEEVLKKQKQIELSFEKGLEFVWPSMFAKRVKIDVVFPSMHGTYGEDGSLQGLLRMAGVPFVGCDMFASAVAMDKVMTKQVLASEGIPVVPYVWFTRYEWGKYADAFKARIKELSYPLFVKPVHLGSSIGMSKVRNEKELVQGIEVALHYDDKVLVEEGIQNLIEITLPIMGNDDIKTAECERPLNKTEFFDFNDKYMSGGKKGSGGLPGQGANSEYSEVPAQIGEKLTKTVKDMGVHAYRSLGCEGTARIDFLIDSVQNRIYVNEVNTLPGSLYHHNWKKAGVSNMDLVLGLVKLGEARAAEQGKTKLTFASDILKKVGGPKVQ